MKSNAKSGSVKIENDPAKIAYWMKELFKEGKAVHGDSIGDKLKGKKFVLSFITGAFEAQYSHKER